VDESGEKARRGRGDVHHSGDGTFVVDGDILILKGRMFKCRELQIDDIFLS
jgi:uncharacterized protein with PhoU and TrkA domain